MLSVDRVISVFAVAAYLSAAFLPCEPVGEVFSSAPPGVESHVIPAAPKTTASASHQSHHASHKDHGAHDTGKSQDSHHKVATETTVVWMPTCLCGCGESRAQIGGGAARLGPVVPAASVALLPPRLTTRAVRSGLRLVQAPDYLIDPIPT